MRRWPSWHCVVREIAGSDLALGLTDAFSVAARSAHPGSSPSSGRGESAARGGDALVATCCKRGRTLDAVMGPGSERGAKGECGCLLIGWRNGRDPKHRKKRTSSGTLEKPTCAESPPFLDFTEIDASRTSRTYAAVHRIKFQKRRASLSWPQPTTSRVAEGSLTLPAF